MVKRTFLHIMNDYLDGKINIKEFFKQIEEYEKIVKPNRAMSDMLVNEVKSIKEEIIDKVTILDKQLKRLQWYLNEIRNEELKSLDVDWDEYEMGCETTDYSNIINLVEEALYERPQENCRYNEEDNQ